jgi:hypothetical protein
MMKKLVDIITGNESALAIPLIKAVRTLILVALLFVVAGFYIEKNYAIIRASQLSGSTLYTAADVQNAGMVYWAFGFTILLGVACVVIYLVNYSKNLNEIDRGW